ncbi:MAG: endolytic transglycosylase MltG [Microscillaceae bacterium]
MKLTRREVFFGSILLVSFLLSFSLFYVYQIFRSPNFQVGKKEASLIIPEGTDFSGLMQILERENLIQDKISFAFLSKLFQYQQNVKPGRYQIKPNMNNWEVIRMLRAGLQSPVRLTFNNIRTKSDFAQRIARQLSLEASALEAWLKDTLQVKEMGFDTSNILVMFIPNTYELYWNTPLPKFIQRMYKEYQKFWNARRRAQAQKLGLTPIEVSILASIVQAETNQNLEKPRIAGVYLNRLRRNIKLEADPTVIFALGDFNLKRVLRRHLETPSPYNTYLNTGLPPGPINLPTPASIEAVLQAETHEYLFFCAKEDFSGYHTFAKTYAEHQRNARLFQKALDMRGIK